MEQFALSFDSRSDGGPRLVGPFFSRQRAEEHLQSLAGPGWSSESSIVPLGTVGESLQAAGVGVSQR